MLTTKEQTLVLQQISCQKQKKTVEQHFEVLKGKKEKEKPVSVEFSTQQKTSFKHEGKLKVFF